MLGRGLNLSRDHEALAVLFLPADGHRRSALVTRNASGGERHGVLGRDAPREQRIIAEIRSREREQAAAPGDRV